MICATELCAQTAATEKPSPASTPAGVITGQVVDQAGEPLAGATAYASPIANVGPSRNVAAVDSKGNFSLTGLEPGVYVVSASLPGFISESNPVIGDSRRYYRPGDSVSLMLVKGGVITGKVTTAANAPLVAASVRAFRVRDANGKPSPTVVQMSERLADDRGIYRLYGLPPGTYIVSAGGAGRIYGGMSVGPYENEVPTYAPSGTRDTAAEIVVRNGEETNIDIQYRGEPGHAVSGALAGVTESRTLMTSSGMVNLVDVTTHTSFMSLGANSYDNYSFAFYGVPDGEYELFAQQNFSFPAR